MGFAIRLLFAGIVLAACAGRPPAPSPPPPQASAPATDQTAPFGPVLEFIGDGEIDRLLALRGETGDSKMGDFLRQLYVRYGQVERIDTLAVERVGEVSRGVFLAEHEYGPFVWDIITDGSKVPLLRASNELEPYLRPTVPPTAAAALASTSIDRLNAGKSTAVFPLLVCRCMTELEFRKQVDVLARHGGKEETRRLVRAETIPGLEERLVVMHYLSERGSVRLGFHFTLWKVKDAWRINAVNWTQEELLPPPLAKAPVEPPSKDMALSQPNR